MKLWGPAALAAMLTIAACGGTASDVSARGDQPTSTSSAASSSTTSTAVSTSTASSTAVPSTTSTTKPGATTIETDRQIELAAALRLSDLPAGWASEDDTDEPQDDDLDRELAQCMGMPTSFMDDGSDGEQPSFASPNGQFVTGGASLAPARAEVTLMFDVVERPRMLGCLEDLMQQSIDRQFEAEGGTGAGSIHIGPVTARHLDYGRLGDRAVVFRIAIPVSVEGLLGTSMVMTADLVFVQRGRAVVMVMAMGEDAPVPQSLVVDLVGKIGSRLPASVTA